MATDRSLLSADIGQKNLLVVFEPLIYQHLNQPSRILPHLNTLIPLSMDTSHFTVHSSDVTARLPAAGAVLKLSGAGGMIKIETGPNTIKGKVAVFH